MPSTNRARSEAEPRRAAQALDLQQVETLLAVLATGSFAEAGRRLGYAQPTVSQQMKRLEAALGQPLIERRPDGCVATRAGAIFRPYAESLIRLSERAQLALVDHPLAIGTGSNIGIYLVQPAVKAFESRPAAAPIELTIGPNPDIAERLEDGAIDVALLEWWDDRPGFTAVPWRREALVVIVDPAHPWAGRESLDIACLAGVTLLGGEPGTGTGRILSDAFRESGVALGAVRSLGSTEAVKRAVAAGNGVSIVLAGTVEQETRGGFLVALPVAGAALEKTLYAVHRALMPMSAPGRAFVDLLVEGHCASV